MKLQIAITDVQGIEVGHAQNGKACGWITRIK